MRLNMGGGGGGSGGGCRFCLTWGGIENKPATAATVTTLPTSQKGAPERPI